MGITNYRHFEATDAGCDSVTELNSHRQKNGQQIEKNVTSQECTCVLHFRTTKFLVLISNQEEMVVQLSEYRLRSWIKHFCSTYQMSKSHGLNILAK